MFIRSQDLANTTIEADVVIIGAGPAGITIMRHLIEGDSTVAVLESGGFEPDHRTQELAHAESAAVPYTPFAQARLRCFGGSTLRQQVGDESWHGWGGYCAPLDESVFLSRPWMDGVGWAFGRAAMVADYEAAARDCSLRGWNTATQDWARLSRAYPLDDTADIQTRTMQICPASTRFFGQLYRSEIADSTNVRVYLRTTATALEFGTDGVKCVRATNENGDMLTIRGRRYVLATGGIDNARLLLESGFSSPVLGMYYADHPHVEVAEVRRSSSHDLSFYRENMLQLDGAPYPSGFIGVLGARPSSAAREGIGNFAVFLDEMDDRWVVTLSMEPTPCNESVVSLSTQKDRLGMRLARVSWQLADQDFRAIEIATEMTQAALSDHGFDVRRTRKRLGRPLDQKAVFGGHHHMATTRMHVDPKLGVVDEKSRVHGTSNLFIAGSSVFPVTGENPPTLTIVALANRLGRHLKSGCAAE